MTAWTTLCALCSGLGTVLVYGLVLAAPSAMLVQTVAQCADRARVRRDLSVS